MKHLLSFLIIFLLLIGNSVFSQKKYKPFQTSEVKKGDLGNKPFKDFPSASARIIFDYGEVSFIAEDDKFVIERTRHLRVKFVDDTLISAHNLGLTSFDQDEIVSFLHYGLRDGEIVITEIDQQWSGINKYKILVSQIENFQVGDILEFQFKEILESPADIPGWQFEYEIPVDYSEFYAEVPGMFKYRPIFKGYVPLKINSSELLKDQSKNWVEIDGFYVYQNRFLCTDIAPFEKVVYSPSSKNYLTSIDFYLEGIKDYMSYKETAGLSWDQVAYQLFKDEKLNGRIEQFDASQLITRMGLDSNKARSVHTIYNWVRNTFEWNGDIGIFAEHSLDELVKTKKGSVAEINLLLTALMNEAGIYTRPTILRTIDQGEVNMEFPSPSQFNYLVCWVDVSGEKVVLDATEPCLEIGFLRPSCLNNKGLKVTPRFEEWVELEEKRYAKLKVVSLASVVDNSLVSTMSVSKQNYYAYEDCLNYSDFDDVVRVKPGLIVSDIKMSRMDSLSIGSRILFNCNADSLVDKNGSTWTFQPFWVEGIKNSPFEAKERKFPIVFPYLIEKSWSFVLSRDEKILISSLPKNEEISTPDNSMRFVYEVKVLDDLVQLNAQLSILRRRFDPSNYENILEFYEDIQKKLKEEIKIKVKQ